MNKHNPPESSGQAASDSPVNSFRSVLAKTPLSRALRLAMIERLRDRDHPQHGLTHYPQWLNVRMVPGKPNEKFRKVPFDPGTGHPIDPTAPANHKSFEAALAAYDGGHGDAIGFVFTDDDPFFALDLDDVSAHEDMAVALECDLAPCAVERSYNGDGLHIIGSIPSPLPLPPHVHRNKRHALEFYTRARYFVITGWDPRGNVLAKPRPDAFLSTLKGHFAQAAQATITAVESDVDEAADVAIAAVLASDPVTADVWAGDFDDISDSLRHGDGRADRSQVDHWLACRIVEHVGPDPARIARVLQLCDGLRREKWSRKTYLLDTARSAAAKVPNPASAFGAPANYFEHKRQQVEENRRIGDALDTPPYTPVQTLNEMLADMVFVSGAGAVASRGRQVVRKSENAHQELAASKTEVSASDGRKAKSISTSKLWMQHPSRLTVDVVTWWPGCNVLCEAPEQSKEGLRAFNTYRPLAPLPVPDNWRDWVQAFLTHAEYLIPVVAERERFLMWLAHIFQKPEVLPHTCYLFVTEPHGVGRGTFFSMIIRALRGYAAANVSVATLLEAGSYNGQLSQKLLATVDEIQEGGTGDRYKRAQKFRATVTEETRLINPKYGVQSIEKNCCRWLMASNHFDALPLDNRDRRLIVIENPRDLQPPEYFRWLHANMAAAEFVASLQHYLLTLDITTFDPGAHAPMNAAKTAALLALESEVDKVAKSFKELWPGEYATVSDLRLALGNDAAPSAALGHAIKRAGMKTLKGKLKIGPRAHTVIDVKGTAAVTSVTEATAALREKITSAQTEWGRP